MHRIKGVVAYFPLTLIIGSTLVIAISNVLELDGLWVPYAIIGYFMSFVTGFIGLLVVKGERRKVVESTMIIASAVFIAIFLAISVAISRWQS